MAHAHMSPASMSGVALDSEYILRYETAHAGPLSWGRFAKSYPCQAHDLDGVHFRDLGYPPKFYNSKEAGFPLVPRF